MKILIDGYYRFLKMVLTLLMGLMLVPVILQIVSRYFDMIPRFIWTEEVARFCFVWIIMIGSMIAVRDGAHFDVDLLPHPRSSKGKAVFQLIVHLAMSLMALVFIRFGFDFARLGIVQSSEMSEINMLSIYISFPLAGASWLLFLSEKIVIDIDLIFETDSGEKA